MGSVVVDDGDGVFGAVGGTQQDVFFERRGNSGDLLLAVP